MCDEKMRLFPILRDNVTKDTTAQGFVVQITKSAKINNAPIIGVVKKDNL